MAIRNKPLTARDRQHVRETAHGILREYHSGESGDASEVVMLSTGYAEVHIVPDSEDGYLYVLRRGQTIRVPMAAGRRRIGAKRKAGRKTSTRKKVSSRKVTNPARKRKAPSKAKASATYVVAIFDPEAGHFVRHSRMKGTTVRDVERRVMAKWGLDSDDVKVTKAPAKKAR